MLVTSVSVWMSMHRRGLIGAEDGRRTADRPADVGGGARGDEREAGRAAAVHEEAVERVGERLHAVEVGDSANADCDSPAAIRRCGRSPLRPAPVRSARATWV